MRCSQTGCCVQELSTADGESSRAKQVAEESQADRLTRAALQLRFASSLNCPAGTADLLDDLLLDGTLMQRSAADESGRTLPVYCLKDDAAAAAAHSPQPTASVAASASSSLSEQTTAAVGGEGPL